MKRTRGGRRARAAQLAHASDGGIFALFTSHGALRRTADAIRGQGHVGARWPLLVQGEGQRDQLLRRFRDAGSAILLGTDSFWEGVDVPGRALRVLILAKLPFKVPTEPLTAARLERLAEAGVRLHPLSRSARGAQVETGFRAVDTNQIGCRRCCLAGPAGRDETLRATMLEACRRPPKRSATGRRATGARRVLRLHSIGTPVSSS